MNNMVLNLIKNETYKLKRCANLYEFILKEKIYGDSNETV